MKQIILLIVFSLLVIKTFCQEEEEKKEHKFSYGFKAGIGPGNFENIDKYINEGYSIANRGNAEIGFIFNYKFNKVFCLGTEILYLYRGGGFKKIGGKAMALNNGVPESKTYYNCHYYYFNSFDIPLYIQVCRNNVYLFSGISASLIKNEVHKYNTLSPKAYIYMDETWHRETSSVLNNTTSFSYFIGFGIKIKSKKVLFQPSFRFIQYLNSELSVGDYKYPTKSTIYSFSCGILF